MLKGLYLTLMVGPGIPVPVPEPIIDALTSVQVTSNTQGRSGFELKFKMTHRSLLQTVFLLAGGGLPPILRVVLMVTINGTPEALMDGVVTKTSVSSGSGSDASVLTVTGEDLTGLMDYEDLSGIPYPGMSAQARVLLILAKYAVFGVVPLVLPSISGFATSPTEMIPQQKDTDYSYISHLAAKTGYVFYLDPGPAPLTSTAYWGPEIRAGVPQPALNVDMDAETNVERLDFELKTDEAVLPELVGRLPIKNFPIPVALPDINPLMPPLGLLRPTPKRRRKVCGSAKFTIDEALERAFAESARAADIVTATGSLDVLRYGRTLKARRLVGVRGAGTAFDGLYFVKQVTHQIKRGEYKQSFALARNGIISTVPRVPS